MIFQIAWNLATAILILIIAFMIGVAIWVAYIMLIVAIYEARLKYLKKKKDADSVEGER